MLSAATLQQTACMTTTLIPGEPGRANCLAIWSFPTATVSKANMEQLLRPVKSERAEFCRIAWGSISQFASQARQSLAAKQDSATIHLDFEQVV
jgi:hypothetical protein